MLLIVNEVDVQRILESLLSEVEKLQEMQTMCVAERKQESTKTSSARQVRRK